MKIEIGQQAPDFSLYNSEKEKIALKDQRGKNVILLFFPQAFTGTCTKELCGVRDNISSYNNTDAVVYGISVDSVFTLAKFKEEQGLNFSLLSDFNKEVSAAYVSLYETFAFEMKGVSKRSAFVIDKQGIVRYSQVLEVPTDVPNFEAIQTVLTSLNTVNSLPA